MSLGTSKPKTGPKGNECCQDLGLKEEEEGYRDLHSKIIKHCLDPGIKAEEEYYQDCTIKAEEEPAIKVEEEIFQEAEATDVKGKYCSVLIVLRYFRCTVNPLYIGSVGGNPMPIYP